MNVVDDLRFKLEAHKTRMAALEAELEQAKAAVATHRRRMEATRASVTHKFEYTTRDGVFDVFVIVGLYSDGTPGEVFVRCAKMGSSISGFVDCWAIGASMLLQLGVPVAKLVEKYEWVRFEPEGAVKMGEEKYQATSLVDAIIKLFKNRYVPKENP